MTSQPVEEQQILLSARELSKSFGGVRVLHDVSIDLHAGEVHALVGENGAGKSSLTKIISGVYAADGGSILLDGQPVTIGSPLEARRHGIALIHQEPQVFPDLDVAENIFMGRLPRRGPFRMVDWPAAYRAAQEQLDALGMRIDPRAKMRNLSIAEQQMVEMANALSQNARVGIMDEPTASLTPSEVAELFRIVNQLRERGAAIVFISHRLEEVFAIADRITVLRDGELVHTSPVAELTTDALIRHMVGRSLGALFEKEAAAIGEEALRVEDLTRDGLFTGISFDVRRGEIVGMAGLVGSGRTDVAHAIFGLDRPNRGRVFIAGRPVQIHSPREAIAHGLAYVPEDRQRHGLLLPLPIMQNVTLSVLREMARGGWLRPTRERATATAITGRLRLRGARDLDQPVGELSGGNQQKIVLAKWLLTRPRILILDEPTRGIDIGAKAEVHRLMSELAGQGLAILMISSDLPEVLAMSDRVFVWREGRLTGQFTRREATSEAVMAAATGQTGTEAAA
jgi:rhamnose transport system ATP-binding protein